MMRKAIQCAGRLLGVAVFALAGACAVVGHAQQQAAPLELYGVSPLHKILQDEQPGADWTSGRMALDCARNEAESWQLVVRTNRAMTDLALQVAELRGPKGATLAADLLAVRKVEWVDINAPFDPKGPSTKPLLRPDPLAPVSAARDRFSVQPDRNLVFWMTLTVPEAAPPGLYTGRVELLAGGASAGAVQVAVKVREFALPKQPILQSMIGLATENIYRAHGCKTREEKEKIIRLYFDEYIRARLSPFLYAPGTMAFNPLPDGCIEWEFVKDAGGKPTGEVRLDFTGFDREGELYLNQRHAFSAFNCAPYLWQRRGKEGKKEVCLRFADAKGTAVERRNPDGAVNSVFDQLVVKVFGRIAAHLSEKGWLDRAIYYVTDEPAEDDAPLIKEICELIRKADPRLRTALTYDPANRPRLAELVDKDGKSLISVWIPYVSQYRESVADEQRKKGADYWLYDVSDTCLISHSGELNRAMFWAVWRRNAHGYLYYLSTWWGRSVTPWDRPNFLLPGVTYQYRQGDGYFFYPPLRRYDPEKPILGGIVTTVRWELMREGAEDYDYLRMLEALTAEAEQRGLPVADRGRRALAGARDVADSMASGLVGYAIRDLKFDARQEGDGAIPGQGWTFNAQEGWLHHHGGKRADLPIRFQTTQPDGRYELVLNVYDDPSYRGRPYSRFLVDGKPYATAGSAIKGATNVPAGIVEVSKGACAFTLSAVDENCGVILYRVGLKRITQKPSADLYAARAEVADAIEAIQSALHRE